LESSLVDQFCELFQGNSSALGTEEGGCARIDPEDWDLYVEAHLRGADVTLGGPGPRGPIGVYPIVHEEYTTDPGDEAWVVKWGCIDFDEGEEASWIHAGNVHRMLAVYNVTSWIERSRSKGYHVWIFAQGWPDAKIMREALLAACQTVGAPTREINPKQTELAEGQLGNYVRLPYPGWLGDSIVDDAQGRRVMVASYDRIGCYSLDEFVSEALAKRTDVAELERLAALYKPPVKPIAHRDWSTTYDGPAADRLIGKARIIWEHGPLEGSDRSDTLWKLARYLREDGRHTQAEAFELLVDADARWGKFAHRPDRDKRLWDIIDGAWR
jgi:hypothetical protein